METRQGSDLARRYLGAFPVEHPKGTSSFAPEEAESVLCRGATIDARSSAILQEIVHASLRDAVDVCCIVSLG